jgi:hypothetical protein
MSDRISPGSDAAGGQSDDMPAEFIAFFQAAKSAQDEQARFGAAARDAVRRLAKAVYGHDNSQALTVAAALASIYNGSDARPVRLDELRWLDWSLQRDLVTVLIGTGHGAFEDKDIREAFREVGGDAAVTWFHWYITGGANRKALEQLVAFIVQNRDSSSARALITLFRSIVHGGKGADLSRLNYMGDELTAPFVMVLDGLWGRDQGALHVEDIPKAFQDAGAGDLLTVQVAVGTA